MYGVYTGGTWWAAGREGNADGAKVGMEEAIEEDSDSPDPDEVDVDIVGVTVGVGLAGGGGLSSRVIVRLQPELDTPVLLPLTASATTETEAIF